MNSIVSKILVESFYNNKSVNAVVQQDAKKEQRLKLLMEYSIFMGEKFGKIYLTEDNKSCAILLDPLKKKTTLRALFWDIKLAFKVIGIFNVLGVLRREQVLKSYYPKHNYMHLWFIGVDVKYQGQRLGSKILKQIISDYSGKDIFLETSTERNFLFYEKHGFKMEKNLKKEIGYNLQMYLHSKKLI